MAVPGCSETLIPADATSKALASDELELNYRQLAAGTHVQRVKEAAPCIIIGGHNHVGGYFHDSAKIKEYQRLYLRGSIFV